MREGKKEKGGEKRKGRKRETLKTWKRERIGGNGIGKGREEETNGGKRKKGRKIGNCKGPG